MKGKSRYFDIVTRRSICLKQPSKCKIKSKKEGSFYLLPTLNVVTGACVFRLQSTLLKFTYLSLSCQKSENDNLRAMASFFISLAGLMGVSGVLRDLAVEMISIAGIKPYSVRFRFKRSVYPNQTKPNICLVVLEWCSLVSGWGRHGYFIWREHFICFPPNFVVCSLRLFVPHDFVGNSSCRVFTALSLPLQTLG